MEKIKSLAYARVDGENPAPIGFDPATNEFRSMSSGPTPTDKVTSDSAFYAMWLMMSSLVHGMNSDFSSALVYQNMVESWLGLPNSASWDMPTFKALLKELINSGMFELTPIQPNVAAKKAKASRTDKTK